MSVFVVPVLVAIVVVVVLGLVYLLLVLSEAREAAARFRDSYHHALDTSRTFREQLEDLEKQAKSHAAGKEFLLKKLEEANAGVEARVRQANAKYEALKRQLTESPPADDALVAALRTELQEAKEWAERYRAAGEALEKKWQRLYDACVAHRDARGHDRCQENTLAIYRALDEPFDPAEVLAKPPLPEWVAGCVGYWLEESLTGNPQFIPDAVLDLLRSRPGAPCPKATPLLSRCYPLVNEKGERVGWYDGVRAVERPKQ